MEEKKYLKNLYKHFFLMMIKMPLTQMQLFTSDLWIRDQKWWNMKKILTNILERKMASLH